METKLRMLEMKLLNLGRARVLSFAPSFIFPVPRARNPIPVPQFLVTFISGNGPTLNYVNFIFC